MITNEQSEEIKKQIIREIELNFPEEKKEPAKRQIASMNSQDLEDFLNQNKIIQENSSKCVFCSIISGEVSSYKIGRNEEAIAVLEINPISRGHSLIIPKNHDSEIVSNSKIQELVLDTIKKLKKLNPKNIETFSQSLFGHKIINVFPIYSDETPSSQRNSADEKYFEEIKIIVEKEEKTEETESKQENAESFEENIRLPRRIP